MITNLKPIPPDAPEVLSRWKHWKGHCSAKVVCVAYHTETTELMVTYLEEKSGTYFVRPLRMWLEEVSPGVTRFRPFTKAELKAEAEAILTKGIADRELFTEAMRDDYE